MQDSPPAFIDPPPEPLPLEPEPPVRPPEPCMVVIGRFQPFHRGHAALISSAIEKSGGHLRIAIGSSNRVESIENPWTWQEREAMIQAWLDSEHPNSDVEIVAIPDIDDPPNWVQHAEQYHGKAGTLFTSDKWTAKLYRESDWPIIQFPLKNRESLEGWRIRGTLRLMSTVNEREGIEEVLHVTIPESVVKLLLDQGWLYRLAFMGGGGEPVG